MSRSIELTSVSIEEAGSTATGPPGPRQDELAYEGPIVRTLTQRDLLSAVKKGSKFPARGFAG
jgi:hypothetical protein